MMSLKKIVKVKPLASMKRTICRIAKAFHSTEQTEAELQGQLQEWKEYRDGIDVVLRAWDTSIAVVKKRVCICNSTIASLP